RVEASEIGVVFLAAAVIGLALARQPSLALRARLVEETVLEGAPATLELSLDSTSGVPWLELVVPATAGLGQVGGRPRRDAITVARERSRHLEVRLASNRWGVYRLGPVAALVRDATGFFAYEASGEEQLTLRVFPREEWIARAIRPAETQLYSGDEVSTRKAEGIEFAGVRPFEPGDQVRRINWPVSTRLQKLHINELHPERNADVIVFLDSFSEVAGGDDSTLVSAVRAAATIVRHYLRRRDRVGLVGFGGTLRWQVPAMGVRQAYRIIDALLSTDAQLSYAWKGVDVIPAQTLPPKALVIALTPLLDRRTTAALIELRARGFDLVVVEVSPMPYLESPRTEEERLAYTLFGMRREAARFDLWSQGIPVTEWVRGQPLVAALEEMERFRRHGRKLRIS
ncbi:MAG TPA: DUF58 domain-containing protein, partial [Candidatus Dormibacteraeota bacterium]|nr:DUF58 domain-containing protein [Candidatus Dormibacteraeota bacterium]